MIGRLEKVELSQVGPWICAVCMPDTQQKLCGFVPELSPADAACHVKVKNLPVELLVLLTFDSGGTKWWRLLNRSFRRPNALHETILPGKAWFKSISG